MFGDQPATPLENRQLHLCTSTHHIWAKSASGHRGFILAVFHCSAPHPNKHTVLYSWHGLSAGRRVPNSYRTPTYPLFFCFSHAFLSAQCTVLWLFFLLFSLVPILNSTFELCMYYPKAIRPSSDVKHEVWIHLYQLMYYSHNKW